MITRKTLYEYVEGILNKAREEEMEFDSFMRGFYGGRLLGAIGICYQAHIIDTNEFSELTDSVCKEIKKIADEKAGAKDEHSRAKLG